MSVKQIGTTGNSTAVTTVGNGTDVTFPTNFVIIGAVVGALVMPILTGKVSKTQIPIGALIGALIGYFVGRK